MNDHRSLRSAAVEQHGQRLRDIQRQHGGAATSDEAEDKKIVRRAIGQHDTQLHPGRRTKLKLRDGGHIEGDSAPRRLDRPGRKRAYGGPVDDSDDKPEDPAAAAMSRAINAGMAEKTNPAPTQMARGGAKSGKRGGKGKAGAVNVIVATGQNRPQPVPVPVPVGGPRPPMPPPGAGAPPGVAMPPPGVTGGMPGGLTARPPVLGTGPGALPMREHGGKVMAGARSAVGRLQKAKTPIVSANAMPG